ncbi:MAG: 23S rRNA (uracil(1939)-C(5))-methyltransferase RlmD [Fervidobacterium sp.]
MDDSIKSNKTSGEGTENNDQVTVYIERIAYGGYGIGKLPGGKLIFVEGAYPSELVNVQITEEKKDIAFGKVSQLLEKAKYRRSPKCKYFGVCGGCHIMDVEYPKQLEFKRDMVKDQLRRIGKMDVEVNPVIPSDMEYEYRNKIEFTFGYDRGELKLGLNKRGTNEIVNIDQCPISPTSFNRILKEMPEIIKMSNVKIYNPNSKAGTMKHLVLRYSNSNNQTMVILVTKTEKFQEAGYIRSELLKRVPQVNSIIHVMNSSDEIVLRGPYETLYGSGILEMEMDYEKFQIPPTAFFQNNFNVAAKMVEYMTKGLELTGSETVLDLYAGVGTFTMRLAMLSKYVTAIESSHIAVKAGRANANINGVRNVRYEEADVDEFLNAFQGRADVVVADPPRAGLDKKVCNEILKLAPQKIAYVSCDPATLARDLAMLKEKYEILSVQPFDMFPQTYHVENVVLLSRKDI